jgi:hypothetical protein
VIILLAGSVGSGAVLGVGAAGTVFEGSGETVLVGICGAVGLGSCAGCGPQLANTPKIESPMRIRNMVFIRTSIFIQENSKCGDIRERIG